MDTMKAALMAACNPAMGLSAFIAWAVSQATPKTLFFLLDYGPYDDETRMRVWVEDSGDGHWRHTDGWLARKNWADKVIEQAYAASFQDCDWKKSSHYIENGTSGWLHPDGTFYGCRYGGHCNLAHWVLKLEYYEMEQNGWLHVDCAGVKDKYTFRPIKTMTPQQEAWLVANGHDMDPHGYKAKKAAGEREEKAMIEKLMAQGQRIVEGVDPLADRAAFERMMAAAPKRPRGY